MSYIESYEGISPSGNTDTMSHIYVDSPAVLRLSDCLPVTGDYTLQFWIKSGSALSVFLEANGIHRYIDVTTDWVKYEYTFTVTDNSDNAVYFSFPIGVYYLYHVKLEMGDTSSDWTPAPEDSESIIIADIDTRLYRLSDKYTDVLGCDNGLWYIERNTKLITLNGSEDWWDDGAVYGLGLPIAGDAFEKIPTLCSHFTYTEEYFMTEDNQFTAFNEATDTYICINHNVADDLDAFKAWLSNNPITVLLPANTTTVPLANYIQSILNNITANGDLTIYMTDENVRSIRGSILIKPIVFGKVNKDMSVLINNASDSDIGFIYQIHCKDKVVNPAIYHTETNQHIKITGNFKRDDVITIDTRRGKKSITKTYRGINSNIINSLNNTSKWLQLQSGVNHLIQSADSGADYMDSTIIYTNEYEGV